MPTPCASCCTDATHARHAETIALLPDEVVTKHYGCGCPLPEDDLTGLTCLDLGSGAGVDAFILSRLVGPEGHLRRELESLDAVMESAAETPAPDTRRGPSAAAAEDPGDSTRRRMSGPSVKQ